MTTAHGPIEGAPDVATDAANADRADVPTSPPDTEATALVDDLHDPVRPDAEYSRNDEVLAERPIIPQQRASKVAEAGDVPEPTWQPPVEVAHDATLGVLWVGLPEGHLSADVEDDTAYIEEIDADAPERAETLPALFRALGDEAVRHNLTQVVTSTHDKAVLNAVASTYGDDAEHLSFFGFSYAEGEEMQEVALPMDIDQARASLDYEAEKMAGMSPAELEDYVPDPLNMRSHLVGRSNEPHVDTEALAFTGKCGPEADEDESAGEQPSARADLSVAVGGTLYTADRTTFPDDRSVVFYPEQPYQPLPLETYDPNASPEQVIELLQQLQARGSGHPIDNDVIDRYLYGMPLRELEANLITETAHDHLVQTHAGELPWRGTQDVIWTSYDMARAMFERLELEDGDTFCDLGSGYGQLLVYGGAQRSGVQFTGRELVEERVEAGKGVVQKFGLRNVTMQQGNVLDHPFKEDAYFMYRPFSVPTFREVASRINQQVEARANAGGKPLLVITRGSVTPFSNNWPDRDHFKPVRQFAVHSPSTTGTPNIRVFQSIR